MDWFGGGEAENKPSKKVDANMSNEEKAKLQKEQALNASEQTQESKKITAVETMKDGDYQIHIHILKGKGFQLDDEEDTDPYIKVKCMDQQKQTTAKNNISPDQKVTWDEHIFLDYQNLSTEQIENASINLVAENKGFFKGDKIGEFTIGVNKIYSMKDHALRYQIIGLNNPDGEDFSQVTGYITVSIQVIGPGDEAIELDFASEHQIQLNKPMLPTQIKLQYKQVYMRFFLAENLPIMDQNLIDPNSIDAYLKIFYNGTMLRTKVYTMKNKRVFWNQEIMIPIEIPLRQEKIKIQLWDYDTFVDEFVCSLEIPVKTILKYEREDYNQRGGATRMKWINFYGPPAGTKGEEAAKMRRDSTLASKWAGRMLIEYFCVEEKYPTFKLRHLRDQSIIQHAANYLKEKQYLVCFEAGSGITLPGTKDYYLHLNIGALTMKASPVKSRKNYVRWDKQQFQVIKETYQHLKEFPTVYFYLTEGENGPPICFYRESLLKFTQFVDSGQGAPQDGPYYWFQFEPDLAVGNVRSRMNAGIFSVRLYIHDLSLGDFDPKDNEAWKKRPPRQLNPFRMRACIYQAESLPPLDVEGNSDPYVEIWSADEADEKRIVTTVCNDTNNPIFYEVKEFNMEYKESSLDSAMPIVLNIYDKDEDMFDKKDDLIGRAIIYLDSLYENNLISEGDQIPMPQWYPIKRTLDEEYDRETGASILVAFQKIPRQDNYTVTDTTSIELDQPNSYQIEGIPQSMPNLDIKEYKVDIIVLGLRNLISTGLFPVNKAYVSFNLKSLLPAAKARAVANVMTQPNDKGNDPNIRTTISFEVQMPSNPLFAPRMTCDVYDLLFFGGAGQPHVGTFSLELGTRAEEIIKKAVQVRDMLLKTNGLLDTLRNQVEIARQGDPNVRVLNIVNEQVQPKQSPKKNAQSNEDRKAGARVLDTLNKVGLKLPSSTDRNRKKTAQVKEAGENEQDDENLDFDAVFQAVDVAGKQSVMQKKRTGKEEEGSVSAHGRLSVESVEDKKNLKRALGSAMRRKIEAAFNQKVESQKQELEKARAKHQKELDQNREDGQQYIIRPQYELDERLNVMTEVNPPFDTLFMEIGHDPVPGAGKKHYRRYFPDELENVVDKDGHSLVDSPFMNRPCFRAKQDKKRQSLLSSLFQTGGDEDDSMSVYNTGSFKGIVRVYEENVRKGMEAQILATLKDVLYKAADICTDREAARKIMEQLMLQLQDSDTKAEQASVEKTLDQLRKILNKNGLARLGIHQVTAEIVFQYSITSKLNQLVNCKVRIYVLDGFNFAKRDMFSQSDPFLVLKCGKNVINDRENYQLDTNCPEFYKDFEFYMEFPGAPTLTIDAYDHDGFFGDELIGTTKMDLDDRYYSLVWQSMDNSPVEFRDLYHPSSTVTQGVLKMWVEINEKDSKNAQRASMNVRPSPTEVIEVRLVVWRTEGIPIMDVEGTSDIQIQAGFDSTDMQYTDTHWRCQNGEGSFNYRMKIPITNKKPEVNLRIEAIDRDIIKNNDVIGGCELNLLAMRQDVMDSGKKQILHKDYFENYLDGKMQEEGCDVGSQISFDPDDKQKFWIPVNKYEEGSLKDNGQILVTLHMVPEWISKKYPQGESREEPNSDPYCPSPEGRIKFTINPFEMIPQLVPASALRKILYYAMCLACCFLVLMMVPNILANMVTNML